MSKYYTALIAALAATATLVLQAPAHADPPSWSPAGEDRDQGDRPDDQRDDRRDHRRDDRRDERRDDRQNDRRDERQGERDDRRYGDYYQREGHPYYRGYRGDDWDNDYGVVSSGRCDSDAVLGVAGAVTGAIIGSRNASPENRGIATVFGAIAGGLIGGAVGNAIDDGDRGCMGQSFELARIGQPVVWENPRSHVAWRVLPLRDVSPACREFELRRGYGARYGSRHVVACRRGRGDWAFR